jgi:hypothetical protein
MNHTEFNKLQQQVDRHSDQLQLDSTNAERTTTLRKAIHCLAQMYQMSQPLTEDQKSLVKAYHKILVETYLIIKNQ